MKDLRQSIQDYKALGFEVVDRETLRVVKMQDSCENMIELVKGNWKPHLCVNFYETLDGNYIEVVCQSKS